MNASANLYNLYITGKGEDEIAHRTHKLGIQYRSILLLLSKPQTLEYLLKKSAFPIEETTGVIKQLLQEQFIAREAESSMTNTARPPVHASTSSTVPKQADASVLPASPVQFASNHSEWNIDDDIDIFLPEAKFLLADFCMDCFGVHAQSLIDEIRACKTGHSLSLQIKALADQLSQKQPERLPSLRKIVREIVDATS